MNDSLTVPSFLRVAVAEAPDVPFIAHGGHVISYAEFQQRAEAAAAAWWDLGVRKGDRVAFMLENRPEFLLAWFGLAQIGAILVAINTRWQAQEISYFLDLTEPSFALVGTPFLEVFGSAILEGSGIRGISTLAYQGENPGWQARAEASSASQLPDFSVLMRDAPPLIDDVDVAADDLLTFISTSGTTGRPKAVMQTHGNFVLTGEGYAHWLDIRSRERLYLCLPLFHINSQAYTVMGAIAARGCLVLVERFSASRFWGDMSHNGVNVFNYIGSMLAVLMTQEPAPQETAHQVRVAYGGPALPGPWREEAESRYGITLISGIGMSETTYGLIESVSGQRRPGSLGKPRQHPFRQMVNEARVVDDDGREVARGEVGELIFRNPVMMKGYYRDPDATAATIRDGWLYTGDLVVQDREGFFYFVDRKKDIIRVRGENVSSVEIERVLSEHPAVHEAAVIGVPSDLTEDDVAAFVVAASTGGLHVEELTAWCRDRLATFKVPKYMWLVESLPKTETQRAEKHRLREMAQGRLAAGPKGAAR
jgi:crotonobetaine/carnitine-CoA ligase